MDIFKRWVIRLSFLFILFAWSFHCDAQNLELSGKFQNCSSDLKFKLNVSNKTKGNVYSGFRIEWGDGAKEAFTGFSISHTYTKKGTFQLKFYGKKADGTEDVVVYPVDNDGGTPELKLAAGGESGVCLGSEISFVLSNLEKNTALTTYVLDYGDGHIVHFTGGEHAGESEIVFKHRYNKSYCDFVNEGGADAGMKISITATNACDESFEMTAGPYKVASPMTLRLNFPNKECTGNPIDFAALTSVDPEDCMTTDLTFDIVGVEDNVAVPYTFTKKGKYTIRVNGIRENIKCSMKSDTKEITIIERVTAVVTPVQKEICEGGSVTLDASASGGDERKYTWSVSNGDASKVEWIPNIHAEKVEARFTKHGTYRIRMQVDNGCSYDYAYVDIVVKKNPEIKEFKALPASCPGTIIALNNYISYDWTWEGNPQQAQWTITGPAGAATYQVGTNATSPFPVILFAKPGTYTLAVELAGVGCGDAAKLRASQTITIYDPEINLGPVQPNTTDICEGDMVTFVGQAQGEIRSQHWSVTTKEGIAVSDVTINTISSAKTTIIFPHFGEYKVKLDVVGACLDESAVYDVSVRRAPELTFKSFPQPFCPTWQFYPGDYINYASNGNADVKIKWEVTGNDPVVLEGATTWNPKVSFTEWGDYTVKVTLTNPHSCGPLDHLTASAILKISNPTQDLKIIPDQTTICAGEKVTFNNTSHVGVTPVYSWGVMPASGVSFDPAHNQQSEDPVIQFDQSGVYTVTAGVQGVCKTETLPFPIIVQKDPEVSIDVIPAICPGTLKLSDIWVHYEWNDNWKVGAADQRIVKWSLKTKPVDAVCTPPESPEWNEHYPDLELKTPGNYVLQAEVKSFADCHGTKTIATREVKVYDPILTIDVKPKASTDLVGMGGNKYQFVEKTPLEFVNNSSGEGLTYKWSVDKPEDCTVSDVSAKQPVITFNNYGTYKVRVDFKGTCSEDFREFIFVVKGIPRITLKGIDNRCANWDEIDMRDYLTCDSAGSKQIFCNWVIEPNNGYHLTDGTLNDMFFKIQFDRPAVYKMTLYTKAEYGGDRSVSTQVRVLSPVVKAKMNLSQTFGCTNDGFKMVALNESVGDSLTFTWKMTPVEGAMITMKPEQLTADIFQAGDYQINLKAENICNEQEVTYPIRAFSKPEIILAGGTNLGTVCEKGYLFKGSEHIKEIKVNNAPLSYINWEVSPQGAKWENGTNKWDEYPELSFEGDKNYVIVGEFKNGCKDTVKVKYTVAVDKYVPVALMKDTVVCAHTEPFLLKATPHGGDWKCTDLAVIKEREGKNFYFDPYKDEFEIFQVTYEKGHGQCLATGTMAVTVNRLPVVDAGADQHACLNDEPVKLIGIDPVVGEWKGTGVKDGWFYPGENGANTFRLEYWYTDAATGCPNLDTINMTVYPLPDTRFKASDLQCRVTDSLYIPLELGIGHHFVWDFGNGDTRETDDKEVKYQYSQVGEYDVVLTATSAHHCKVVGVPQKVKVLDLPPTAAFTVADTAGCGPFTAYPEVDPTHFAGDYYNLSYLWNYGNGNSSTELVPIPQTYQATLFDTVYPIVFKVYNVCGVEMDTINIGAWSKAVAHFAMNPEEEGCTPVEVLFMNKSTGSYNKYTWDFGDDHTSEEIDPIHVFTTNTSMSIFNIKLSVYNRCTPEGSFFGRALKVKPNTLVAGFTKSRKYLCAGDTVCFENNSVDRDPSAALNYSWDFGDGQVASVWDTCHRYENAGDYRVKLKIDNGCAHREFNDSVFVHVLPILKLEGDGPLCEDLELELKLSVQEELKNIVWDFGDGTQQEKGLHEVKHVFQEPGIYQVRVKGEANQIPSCPGEVVKTVEVWSNPRVKITPLDTMACPPLLYRPEVVSTAYDYFTWDYGDGSAQTSDMEHLYTNDSGYIVGYSLTAYVENNYGCKEEHHGLIRIYNAPKVGMDKEITYGRPEKVRFINLSRDYTDCFWYLPFGEVVNSPKDQIVVFSDEGVYPMSLAVVNQFGCRDSLYIEYRSYEGGLYFPNTFIPHSTNAKVSRFNGIGVGLKEYKLEIFDMYGNKVWETRALEGGMPSEGWDGRNKNGKLLPQGVYTWRAEAVFLSEDVWTGKNNRSGIPQTTQGTVLLLRK